MEVLTGESSTSYGRMKFPAEMRIQQIANLSVVFSFMKQHVKLVSIGPQGWWWKWGWWKWGCGYIYIYI
jgi:hypothetical protein